MHYGVTGRNPVFLWWQSWEVSDCRVILSAVFPLPAGPIYHRAGSGCMGATLDCRSHRAGLCGSCLSFLPCKSQGSPWSELSASGHRPSVSFSTAQELCSVSSQSTGFLVISASGLVLVSWNHIYSRTSQYREVLRCEGSSKLCPRPHWSQAGPSASRSLGS